MNAETNYVSVYADSTEKTNNEGKRNETKGGA